MLGNSAAMSLPLSSTLFTQSLYCKTIHFLFLPSKTRECDEVALDPSVFHILMTYKDQRIFFLTHYVAIARIYQHLFLPVCSDTVCNPFCLAEALASVFTDTSHQVNSAENFQEKHAGLFREVFSGTIIITKVVRAS